MSDPMDYTINYIYIGLPRWLSGKESACQAGNRASILGSRRSSGGSHGNPLQYASLENPRTKESGGLQSMGSQRVRHD